MGVEGGGRGRGRAALVMLWAEAGLPELRGGRLLPGKMWWEMLQILPWQ